MKGPNHIPWLLGLMVLFTAMRWPGLLPSNFSPVYAICFCAGLYLSGWRAWAVPLGLLFVSDVVMNYFVYRPMGVLGVFSQHDRFLCAVLVADCHGLAVWGKTIAGRVNRRRNIGCERVFLWKQHTGLAGRSNIRENSSWLGAIVYRGQGGLSAGDYVFPQLSGVRSVVYRGDRVCRAVCPFY